MEAGDLVSRGEIPVLQEFNIDGVAAALESAGVVMLPSFVPDVMLVELNNAFDLVFAAPHPGVRRIDYSVGQGAVCKTRELRPDDFGCMKQFFLQSDFDSVADRVFSDYLLNEDIFVVEDRVGSQHVANDLHYDVLPTLKFFVYLNDVTEAQGAFRCIPGTHERTTHLRRSAGDSLTLENRYVTRELPTNDFPDPVAAEGVAGTLIIFHTDVWHQAGSVSDGVRRVLRGHTRGQQRCQKQQPGPISRLRQIFSTRPRF